MSKYTFNNCQIGSTLNVRSEIKAWEVMKKVVIPRCEQFDIEMGMTIKTEKDWDYGVGLQTSRGIIHVLGTGEIIDPDNILNY